MNAVNALRDAAIGWFEIIANRPGAEARFDFSRSGLIVALVYYFIIVVGLILVDLIVPNAFTYDRLFVGIVFNTLPLIGIGLAAAITAQVFKSEFGTPGLLVPAIYALSFQVLIGVPLSLLLGAYIQYSLTGLLGYMLFRVARYIGKLSVGVSIAFAALSILALVALPLALYMVLAPGAGAV